MEQTETTPQHADRILRLDQVMERTGLGRSSIYRRVADKSFPQPLALSRRANGTTARIGFVEREVAEWVAAKIASRQAA